jgi:hypothetical protein
VHQDAREPRDRIRADPLQGNDFRHSGPGKVGPAKVGQRGMRHRCDVSGSRKASSSTPTVPVVDFAVIVPEFREMTMSLHYEEVDGSGVGLPVHRSAGWRGGSALIRVSHSPKVSPWKCFESGIPVARSIRARAVTTTVRRQSVERLTIRLRR